jgi:hypothetical protein
MVVVSCDRCGLEISQAVTWGAAETEALGSGAASLQTKGGRHHVCRTCCEKDAELTLVP